MENTPRKATDVLLDLESKIDSLHELVMAQELNLRVLSNKLNTLIEAQRQQLQAQVQQMNKPTIHAVDSNTPQNNGILITPEMSLPMEQHPKGFRRTSRPETFAGDDVYLEKKSADTKFPVQLPKKSQDAEVVVPIQNKTKEEPKEEEPQFTMASNAIPVMQRIVDKNGKSIFLADVEVINSLNVKVAKTRTNGTGKWMASLDPGKYKVIIKKRDSVTKDKVEVSQDLTIDGKTSTLNLPILIFK